MALQRTLLCTLILASSLGFAQEKQPNTTVVKDSILPAPHHLFVGVDLFNPVMAAFTDRQGAQAMVSYQLNHQWHAVVEVGFEKNKFDEINWKVDVDGIYAKVGANYYLANDATNPSNGFYAGFRLAYASYNQTINQYAIRDINSNTIIGYGERPKATVSSYWAEFVVGARVQLYKKLYGDLSLHPSVLIGSKKDDGIDPLIIPGYGKNSGPFNLPIFWGISYQLF